ncbi:MAG: sigma-70 family RNA polymerase sigma factor [Prevotellaceae bacterium]|jgi:RNA polymerase sigma-70 factor (ECF subfamily)|nr:sigma-70 family RNA polymerase sigma factor [Prevotellaceae bacterium]
MIRDTDRELIKKALAQDQKAYSRLLSRYRDNIFYYILRMTGNKTDATDLTQETFDKAFRNLDRYNEQYAFSTWLFKIARNSTIDYVRKLKLNILHINNGADEDATVSEHLLHSAAPNPEENMIQMQEESMLLCHIESMKPKYRRLIELRYIKEYAYEEISKELDIPLGTVKTQLFRAKNILAEKILATSDKEMLSELNLS